MAANDATHRTKITEIAKILNLILYIIILPFMHRLLAYYSFWSLPNLDFDATGLLDTKVLELF